MNLRQRVLRFFSPKAEEARMNMREARCRAEAVAEDLSRTMTMHSDEIRAVLRKRKMNGSVK